MAKFNIFKNLNLSEDTHTRLLKRLLHPNGSHNQGILFIKSFINDVLKGDFASNDVWYVNDQEKAGVGSVDLVIRSKNNTYVYIIENKIKGAVDQNSQLYRYWRNLIYPIFENESSSELAKTKEFYANLNQYKIVYLTRKPIFLDEENPSFDKPYASSTKYENFPNKLPMPVTYISYSKEISRWLKNCLEQIENNEELIFSLKQYIEWIKLYDK